MPVITGDCVSPVLAHVCGMHLGYYHVVANWGTGLELEDPTVTLDRLYLETLPALAATLELDLLASADEPAGCRGRALLRPRPPEYTDAGRRQVWQVGSASRPRVDGPRFCLMYLAT